MKNSNDFEIDQSPPRSLREIVLEEVAGFSQSHTDKQGRKHTYPPKLETDEDTLEKLMEKVFKHIERHALSAYRTTQLWAIKAYTFNHILTDAVREAAKEDDTLLDELVQPISEWQGREFDPLQNLRATMEATDYSKGYRSHVYKVASEFVLRYGKKKRYAPDEILEYLSYLRYKYLTKGDVTSTYVARFTQFRCFLDSLPEDDFGKKQTIPIKKLPNMPEEFYQPVFTRQQLESMAIAAIID